MQAIHKCCEKAANSARRAAHERAAAFQAMRYEAERMFRTHEPNAGDSFIHDKRPQARARAAQRSLHPVSRATCLAAGVAA